MPHGFSSRRRLSLNHASFAGKKSTVIAPQQPNAQTARVSGLTRDTPFEVRSIVVGNIQYPPEIVDAVSRKLAATQELERKNTEIEIARREKEKRIIEA
jgi:regulator of protease activity HflC (stomatin/prohibitin superfamily)